MRENNNADKEKSQEEFHSSINLDSKDWKVEANEDNQFPEESNIIYEKEDDETKLISKVTSSNKRRWMFVVLAVLIVTIVAFFIADWCKHSSQESELDLISGETYTENEFSNNADDENDADFINGEKQEKTTSKISSLISAIIGQKGEEQTKREDETFTVEDTDENVVEVVTDASGEEVTDAEGNAVTEVVTEEKTEKEENKPSNEDKPAAVEDPSKWSTAEVLKYYQDATAKVVSEKPGYTKTRSAENKGYEAGAFLSTFKGEVFKFLGIGAENKFEEVVKKGTNTCDDICGDYLKKSTLIASDVTSAKATKSGSNYVITIGIKSGSSQTEGGKNQKNNSPIDKSGICVGNTDRSGFDHKNALIVYDALDDIAGGLTMYEKNNNGKVVATINAATGEITRLVITWDASAEFSNIYDSSAILSISTTVNYSNFGWQTRGPEINLN